MNTLSSRILREIGALSRMVQTMSDSEFKKFNLQKGQFIFITRICENPGISHMELTQMLHVDKGTTSKAIKKLIQMGYIAKKEDPSDSRVRRLFPTDSAKMIYSELIKKEEHFLSVSFKDLTENEIAGVTGLIRHIRVNIEEEWKRN